MTDAIDLSVIVLVWQDRAQLPACLAALGASLAAAQGNLRMEVILVANGVELRAEEYTIPQTREGGARPSSVELIQNATNRGVAAARNQGLRAAKGRYLMLLDVDTRAAPSAPGTLVAYMDAHPGVGLAAPRLEDPDGNLQLTCRKLPTVTSKALRRIPLEWAKNALADEMLVCYDHATPRAVDYVIGACQVIRRETWQSVGELDERYFYGPEDVDYCIRVWRGGWQVVYVPQAVVVHAEQRLTRRNPWSRLTLTHGVGLARYFIKWRYLFTPPRLTPPAPLAQVQEPN